MVRPGYCFMSFRALSGLTGITFSGVESGFFNGHIPSCLTQKGDESPLSMETNWVSHLERKRGPLELRSVSNGKARRYDSGYYEFDVFSTRTRF